MKATLPLHKYGRRHINLPAEIWVGLVFGFIWLFGLAVGLPLNLPSWSSLPMFNVHFFGPLVVAALVQLVVVVGASKLRRESYQGDRFSLLKLLPLVVLSSLLYFNFKAWMPLVNPRLYDQAFYQADLYASPLLYVFGALRQQIAGAIPWYNMDMAYNDLFFLMFFVSFSVHALVDTPHHQRQLVLGMCLNLLLGGISYWIAPAEGPFLYRTGLNASVVETQFAMHDLFTQVRETGTLPAGYFIAPLAAMPSLHIAHSLFFILVAARSARWLLILYLPIFFWITIESVSSGWHYLVDLPAGALLAIVSFSLARRWIAKPQPHTMTRKDLSRGLAPSAWLSL